MAMSPSDCAHPPRRTGGAAETTARWSACRCPRHCALSRRIAASSVSSTRERAVPEVRADRGRGFGRARAARSPRRSASQARCFDDHVDQPALASRSFAGLALCRRRVVVGLDDARDEFMAHDVIRRERHMADALDVGEQTDRLGQARRSGRAADRSGSDRRSRSCGCSRRAASETSSSASRSCSAPRRESRPRSTACGRA